MRNETILHVRAVYIAILNFQAEDHLQFFLLTMSQQILW